MRTAEGKLHLYVGIDRTRKFAPSAQLRTGFVQLVAKANRVTASAFLVALIAAVPYKIHTVLTDNPVLSDCRRQAVEGGIQFTFPPRYADGSTATWMTHMFNMRCNENGIEHRLTKACPRRGGDQTSLDQRTGRANEPDDQGSHRQTIPL